MPPCALRGLLPGPPGTACSGQEDFEGQRGAGAAWPPSLPSVDHCAGWILSSVFGVGQAGLGRGWLSRQQSQNDGQRRPPPGAAMREDRLQSVRVQLQARHAPWHAPVARPFTE